MTTTHYAVTFRNANTGDFEVSRHFQTLRAARRWAAWLGSMPYASAVTIYRGGPGGEVVA